jgi:hypothetical protein
VHDQIRSNTKTEITYHPLESEPPSDPNTLEWAIVASPVDRCQRTVAVERQQQAALAEQPAVVEAAADRPWPVVVAVRVLLLDAAAAARLVDVDAWQPAFLAMTAVVVAAAAAAAAAAWAEGTPALPLLEVAHDTVEE